MDRLRDLTPVPVPVPVPLRLSLLALLALSTACKDDPPEPEDKPLGRFAAVKTDHVEKAATSFCERSFPNQGHDARKWSAPPERALPAKAGHATDAAGGWTWVNLWASWCGPCIKEMPLLDRWGKTLKSEGIPVAFEFWSIDESEDDLKGALNRDIPGRVRWLRGPDDLAGFLEGLGVERDSAIPIHALVDRAGMVRCVRVGSVGEEAYGAVKALLAGG